MRTRVMVATVALVAGSVGLLVGGRFGGGGELHAQSPCSVPKAYGTFKQYEGNSGQLIFEDSQGTLRFIDPRSCKVNQQITRR